DLARVEELRQHEEAVLGIRIELLAAERSTRRGIPDHRIAAIRDLGAFAGSGLVRIDHDCICSCFVSGMSGYAPVSSCTSRPVTGGWNTQTMRISVSARRMCSSCLSSAYMVPSEIGNPSPVATTSIEPLPPTQYTA